MEIFFSNELLFGESILNSIHLFIGSWFDYFMILITTLGDEIFFITCIPILYWCYDKNISVKIGGVFLLSVILNDLIKHAFQNPRPDPNKLIDGIRELNVKNIPNSPGFPSGHSQNAVVFWSSLAYYMKNKYMSSLCLLLIILIPYSRLYLGVHYLGDVIGGLLFGLIILVLFIVSILFVEKKFEMINRLALIAVFMIVPYILFKFMPGQETSKTFSVLSGFLTGILLASERIDFSPSNRWYSNICKIVIGLIGVFIFKSGLKYIMPDLPASDYFRYWIMGFWITFMAPFIFSKIDFLRGDI